MPRSTSRMPQNESQSIYSSLFPKFFWGKWGWVVPRPPLWEPAEAHLLPIGLIPTFCNFHLQSQNSVWTLVLAFHTLVKLGDPVEKFCCRFSVVKLLLYIKFFWFWKRTKVF